MFRYTRDPNEQRAATRAVSTLEAVTGAGVFIQPEVFRNLAGAYWVLSAHDSTARAPMLRSLNHYLELVPGARDQDDVRAMMAR